MIQRWSDFINELMERSPSLEVIDKVGLKAEVAVPLLLVLMAIATWGYAKYVRQGKGVFLIMSLGIGTMTGLYIKIMAERVALSLGKMKSVYGASTLLLQSVGIAAIIALVTRRVKEDSDKTIQEISEDEEEKR